MVSLKVGRGKRFFQMFFQNFSCLLTFRCFSEHFDEHLSSLLELPRRGRTAHDHQGRQSAEVSLFLPFYS